MARRSPSFLDALAHAPWPIGLVAGAAVLVVAHILPAVLGSLQNPYLSALGMQLASGALKPLFWMLAGVCWLAALISRKGGQVHFSLELGRPQKQEQGSVSSMAAEYRSLRGRK